MRNRINAIKIKSELALKFPSACSNIFRIRFADWVMEKEVSMLTR